MQKFFAVFLILIVVSCSVNAQTTNNQTEELVKLNGEVVDLFREAKYAEALKASERATELAKKLYGDESVEYARVMSNLAYIYDRLGDARKSISFAGTAVRILKKKTDVSGESKTLLAGMLEQFAWKKSREEGMNSAKALMEAIEYRKGLSGEYAPQLTLSYYYLGDINYWNRDLKEAAKWMKLALDLYLRNKSLSDDNFLIVYSQWECAMTKLGKDTELKELQNQYAKADKDASPLPSLVPGGIVNGKALNLVTPPYPEAAKAQRASGKVEIKILISTTGRVLAACGRGKENAALIEVSEMAALSSKFSPTPVGGVPVNVKGTIIYVFGWR